MLKDKKLADIINSAIENNKESFSWMSEDAKEKVIRKATNLEEDIKGLSFKRKLYLANIMFNLFLEGKNSVERTTRGEDITLEASPFMKYRDILKRGSSEDVFFQAIPETKLNRMTGKIMQVIEMLPLDEQKQQATKSVIKDYIYDCMNDNSSVRDDVWRELLKDGLPTETHLYN